MGKHSGRLVAMSRPAASTTTSVMRRRRRPQLTSPFTLLMAQLALQLAPDAVWHLSKKWPNGTIKILGLRMLIFVELIDSWQMRTRFLSEKRERVSKKKGEFHRSCLATVEQSSCVSAAAAAAAEQTLFLLWHPLFTVWQIEVWERAMEKGEPVTVMVIDWQPSNTGAQGRACSPLHLQINPSKVGVLTGRFNLAVVMLIMS